MERSKVPKNAFHQQKSNAKSREIEWLLTFEEWWQIWKHSGKWSKRGRSKGQYCMCRIGDKGPYAKGNVKIATVSANVKELIPYVRTDEWKRKLVERMKGHKIWLGRKHKRKTKKKISKSNKGRVPGFGGKHHSEKTKKLKRRTWKNQYSSGPDHQDRR